MTLGIYGSGGLGREVLEIAKQVNYNSPKWDEIIFIDDFSNEESKNGIALFPFSKVMSLYPRDTIEIVVAIGEPANRKAVYEEVETAGFSFATVIHPSVRIPETTKVGKGTIVCAFSSVSCNVEIGINSCVQHQSIIAHDCSLGNHVVISLCAALAGGCSVGEGTYIGMGSLVKEKLNIGSWVIIGMASSVYRDVEDNVVVVGNPARILRSNDDKKVFR